jgi:AcrR family transcriptional regulator
MSLKQDSSGSRVKRKMEKTRQKIISVAVALFKSQGFTTTTMEQIAQRVDIAKGTLYNYFPAKEAILSSYINASFQQHNAERMLHLQELPDTRSRMKFIFSQLMEGVETQSEIFEKYIEYRIQNIIAFHQDKTEGSGFNLLGSKIIELGQKSAEIRKDWPLFMLEDLFEFAFIEVAKQFYREPEKFNARMTIDRCVDLFMNGAGKPGKQERALKNIYV